MPRAELAPRDTIPPTPASGVEHLASTEACGVNTVALESSPKQALRLLPERLRAERLKELAVVLTRRCFQTESVMPIKVIANAQGHEPAGYGRLKELRHALEGRL